MLKEAHTDKGYFNRGVKWVGSKLGINHHEFPPSVHIIHAESLSVIKKPFDPQEELRNDIILSIPTKFDAYETTKHAITGIFIVHLKSKDYIWKLKC